MAVIQISRIQVRRGLHDNLPSLASAEMGWSLDQRRLFIGNGTTDEGAPVTGRTEIITEHSDILALINVFSFKGQPAGFIAATGPNNTQFTRSLQEKLDDFVNVRDFGAKGDGITDDTAAITRALHNTFGYTSVNAGSSTRRTVYFPSGKYLVSDVIKVPPFTHLVGDSAETVQIFNESTTSLLSIFEIADSNDNVSTSFGNAVGLIQTQTKDYTFEHIHIQNASAGINPCVRAAGGRKFFFNNVKFSGPAASVVNPGATHSAIYIENNTLNSSHLAKEIKFIDCIFENHGYGIETAGVVSDIVAHRSKFSNLYSSRVFSATTTNYSFIDCVSESIASETNVDTSYVDVRGKINSSIGKTVVVTAGTNGVLAEIDYLDDYENLTVNYVMTIGNSRRKGAFTGVGTGSNYYWQDNYIETNTLNVGLEADSSTGVIQIDATNAAGDITFTYSVEYHN